MERPVSPPAATGVAPTPARALLLCAAFVVIGACLRLPLLDRSVWFDEACMSNQRIGTWPQLLATLYVDIHPPFYVAFMHFWDGLFGDSALSMRLPPLLCGLASIPLLFWTGRHFVSDRAALCGAGLLAISPVHVWYSVEARLYSPMVFCTLLLVGTFERLLSGRGGHRRILWALHLLNLAVMLSLHYYLAVPVAALVLLALLRARETTPNVRPLLLAHGLGILLLGCFVLAKRALGEFETSQEYLRTLDLPGLFDLICRWCWTGNTLAASDLPIARAAATVQVGLGNYAETTFRSFAEHNQNLLTHAALRVYPCAADPADLDLGHRQRDDICYLVRDEWHPAYEVDHTVEDLVQHPRITVLETKRFQGLTVYKVRVKP